MAEFLMIAGYNWQPTQLSPTTPFRRLEPFFPPTPNAHEWVLWIWISGLMVVTVCGAGLQMEATHCGGKTVGIPTL